MDLLDKVLLEWSVRCEKGYPDFNNEQDLAIFESMFGFSLKEEVKNLTSTKKAVKYIVDKVGSKYDIKPLPSKPNRLSAPGIKDPGTFIEIIKSVFGQDTDIQVSGPREKGNPSGKFNMYTFEAKNDEVDFGEVNMIGSYSAPGGAGISNEDIFVKTLNNLINEIGEEANITIKSPQNTVNFSKVTSIEPVGRQTKGNSKSDVQLLSNEKVIGNLSLKQDKGFRWASVFTYEKAKPLISRFEEKALDPDSNFPVVLKENPSVSGKYLMFNRATGDRITRIVIPDFIENDNEINDFVFGSDDPKTVVVGKTWTTDDFKVSGNLIQVRASDIYLNVEDEKKDGVKPVFIIAQHQNKPLGLDYRIFPEKYGLYGERAKGLTISVDDIIR